jgi:hypothetical protein
MSPFEDDFYAEDFHLPQETCDMCGKTDPDFQPLPEYLGSSALVAGDEAFFCSEECRERWSELEDGDSADRRSMEEL